MAVEEARSFCRVGGLMLSRSEGNLIDLGESDLTSNTLNGGYVTRITLNSERVSHTKNPFWNKLSGSNPFLNDIVHSSTDGNTSNTSNLKQVNGKHLYTNNDDAISTSSDEGNVGNFLENKHRVGNRSGRWKSASDILDNLERKMLKQENSFKPPGPVLNPDFEWLKNDREAYKMAWLSHRQLTRSCLDINLMSQSPGWAQTQATDFQVISRIGHSGGSVQLPDLEVSIHVPENHVPPGEIQEVTLKAMLDPPPGLNNNYMTTMSPLLEVILSNINTNECITLDMKLSGEVKSNPLSQVMTTVVGLVSNKKDGPYLKVKDCYIYKNTMQIKLKDLKTHFYVIAVAEASAIQSPATSVWDYLDRQITVALYGPRYIHPSFKVVTVVCCHEDVPPKLPFSDVSRGNKNLRPLLLQLWGKHRFKPDKVNDLQIKFDIANSTFELKPEDKLKEVRQSQLKIGTVLYLPVALSCSGNSEMKPFKFDLQVEESNAAVVRHFQVPSPPVAPIRLEKRVLRTMEKQSEMTRAPPIPEESVTDFSKFEDRPVNLQWYGVVLKSVFRQPHVDYLLEYFKGDTVALLSRETVRSVGNSKVKEWYIAFLRGRIGLVHCKNVKLIARDQVIDFSGVQITTEVLLDNMTLPFKKLTYMYSAIQTMVTEHITSWRDFADALGYKNLSLATITRRQAETEADKVACVLQKLKEDCHNDKDGKKFLHKLTVGLLTMDLVNLVAKLIQNTIILSTAVEIGVRWRELTEKMAKLSSAEIAGYEEPHRGKNGEVGAQTMWKPAYDFLYSWSLRYGDSYRDMIQDLHLVLDKMKNPPTREWRQLTGALITANCLDIFRASAHSKS
ncbi:Metastasis-associated in colon cancer protein 1 SH3 domain-containing protein 7a5 [Channa argus]|uniref:Metastasis-associated in colon cancer protein 1 SH3 domain-containing protein 7a5 n=1 Tax=Channa argus TaxID=215402 RepID=A0A6G1PNB1_CHAAH|nr:Metastasis-associated in colon cancer protein 1 SH3 domain-containing protein 7a5 [Channa argus]